MKWPEKEKLCLSSRNRSDDQDRTGLGNDSVPDSISTLNNAYGSITSTNMRKKNFEQSYGCADVYEQPHRKSALAKLSVTD